MADTLENNLPEQEDSIITLTDEDGIETDFELLDLIEYNGEEYVVLFPTDDEEADQVVILKYLTDGEEEDTFVGIESEELVEEIFNVFKEHYKEEFDFE